MKRERMKKEGYPNKKKEGYPNKKELLKRKYDR
jgi:hypothetical protein